MQIAAAIAIVPVAYAIITGTINMISTTAVATQMLLRFFNVSPIAGNTSRPIPLKIPHNIIKVITAPELKPRAERKLAQEPMRISPMEMLRNMNSQHFWKYLSFNV
jgi:hypothetical protein